MITANFADGQSIVDYEFLWPRGSEHKVAAMFQAYFDESWDQQQDKILVIAGMMGLWEQWSKIEWPWKELLDKYGLAYYRASEAEFARGEFNKEPYRTPGIDTTPAQYKLLQAIREEFFNVMVRGVTSGLAIGIPLKDFRQVANTPERLEKFGNTPYYLCGHIAMLELLKAEKHVLRAKDLVAFIFDTQEEFEPEMNKVHKYLQTPACEFHSQVGSITFADKKKFIPLQIVDTVAYECRKDLDRKMADPNATERAEFTRLKQQGKIFQITLCERDSLEWYIEHYVEPEKPNHEAK